MKIKRYALLNKLLLIIMVWMCHCANVLQSSSPKKTIVTFGDSTTAIRRSTYIYSDILRNDRPYNVVNSGVPGNTTDMAARRFKSDVLDHNPDILIIQFGINDSSVDVLGSPATNLPRTSLDKYEENIESFISQAQVIGVRVILMTSNRIYWTTQWLTSFGASPYDPSSKEGFNVMLDQYAQKIRDIASRHNLTLIDVNSSYKLYSDPSSQLLDDGMHPNNAGHRLVATMIEGKL